MKIVGWGVALFVLILIGFTALAVVDFVSSPTVSPGYSFYLALGGAATALLAIILLSVVRRRLAA